MALYPNVSHFFDSFDCHVSVNSNNWTKTSEVCTMETERMSGLGLINVYQSF
jgi:hypothetical protein